jgi:O-antigen/teichoic acid export membrane protein
MIEPDSRDVGARPGAIKLTSRIGAGLLHYRPQLLALTVRGSSVLAGFAVTYLIGRQFGAAVTGQYALVTQTAMFLAVLALFGLDVSAVRHLAQAVAERRKLALSVLLRIVSISLGTLTLVILVLWLGGEPLWQLFFGDVVSRGGVAVLCVMIIGRGLVQLLGAMLRSQHRFSLGIAVNGLIIPALTAFALATGYAADLDSLLWASAIAGVLATLTGLATFCTHVSRDHGALNVPIRAILLSSFPLWGAGLALVMGEWYGLAVAAQLLGAEAAGLYRVSFQLSGALMMISATLFSVYAAQISTAFHAGNRSEAALLARSAVRLSAALALPLAAILIIGGEFLLGQIGSEFLEATPALTAMVIGQFVIAFLGPSGLVLAMSGHERVNLVISLLGTGSLFLAAPIAAIYGGLTGLAASVAIVLVARNLAAFVYVKTRLKIDIWSGKAR